MRHASLFTGIGGFDLAAEWMGWTNVFQVEIDPFCQKVLQKNFPNAQRHGDIKQFDGSKYRGTIDVLSGGFPCQPYSSAGKRLGKEDERHLWPEMLRVIREVSPRWVVGENVRGLTNWNGGLVFDEVQADLEVAGYEVLPFLLPAAGVGAPHRRYRVWIIAYSRCNIVRRRQSTETNGINHRPGNGREEETNLFERLSPQGAFTDTIGTRLEERQRQPRDDEPKQPPSQRDCYWWGCWPTQSPVCGGNDGISNRVDRIGTLGNAVVPQLAYQIFKAIEQYEQQSY